METLIIILLVIIAILLVSLTGIILYYAKLVKKVDNLLEQGKIKSFKDIFLSQKEKNNELEKHIKDIFTRIESLDNTAKKSIQKLGIIKFNPFNELGGNQSFTIAFLDKKNNGFVFSSLFVKEGHRVYIKDIKNGKSETLMSKEESKAIEKAMR